MASSNYSKVMTYMKNEFNILIVGPAGTGKTSIVKKVADELNLKVKYLDASLSDAFVDLVGIPVPNHEKKIIEFFQTNDLIDADVIIVDELNRGSRDFRNGILEAALEKSLKGVPLPNLKMMVAMMNPAEEGYQVDELDVALVDRFDARLYFDPYIDVRYFTDKFNKEVAKVTKKWWDNYNESVPSKSDKNKKVYISPRRMDKVISGFEKIPSLDTLKDFLPSGVTGDIHGLYNDLNLAFGFVTQEDVEKKKEAQREALRAKLKVELSEVKNLSPREIRTTKSRNVISVIESADRGSHDYILGLDNVFDAIKNQVGPDRLANIWAPIIKDHFSKGQREELKRTWASMKIKEYNDKNTAGDTL